MRLAGCQNRSVLAWTGSTAVNTNGLCLSGMWRRWRRARVEGATSPFGAALTSFSNTQYFGLPGGSQAGHNSGTRTFMYVTGHSPPPGKQCCTSHGADAVSSQKPTPDSLSSAGYGCYTV